jgi:hypothetical protein
MLSKLSIKLFSLLFIVSNCYYSIAATTSMAPVQLSTPSQFPQTKLFLDELQANINWMVAMGIILSLGMMVVHIFFNHNENIIKALFKTAAGLIVLKMAVYLIGVAMMGL